jgi:hypothetical protein
VTGAVQDPLAFAERHNANLIEETERKLRLATRNAWLEQICRRVAQASMAPAVQVVLPPKKP